MSEESERSDDRNQLLQTGHITQLGDYAARLIFVRWFAGALVILATAVSRYLLRLPLPAYGLFGVGSILILYNVLLAAYNRQLRGQDREGTYQEHRRLVQVQIALDWVLLAVFLHLTGGVTSPAIPVLLVHMVMATMLLPEQPPYLFLAISVLVLAALALLEGMGVLPHYEIVPGISIELYRQPVFIASRLGFFALTALVATYLVRQTTEQLRRRDQQVDGLLQATQAVSSTLNLSNVLDRLTASAVRILDKPGASIRLLNESGDELVMTASHGLSQTYLEKGPVRPRSPLDREALLGRHVIVQNIRLDPRIRYRPELLEEGILSMMVIPIIGRERTLGVLRVYEATPNGFSADDISFATAIAQQGAVAIENALAHDELQQLEMARAQYVRMVTHELRSPVAGARSLLRTLLRGLTGQINEMQADILQRIDRRLSVFSALIEDMLTLAASKTAVLQEELEPVIVESIAMQEVERLSAEAAAKGITLTGDVLCTTTLVMATPDGLSSVLGNLIENAIKYTPSGGNVGVKVDCLAKYVSVEVRDDGPGIPEDELPRIWDEFYRSRTVRKSQIPGTGLGLSIVRQLVTRFKGVISVESQEGVGTSFLITLPLADPSLLEQPIENLATSGRDS